MTEIETTIATRSSLNEKTKKVYINLYARLRPLLNKDIIESSEEEISDAIFGTDFTQSVKQNLLNIAIVVRQVFNKPIDELKKVRKIGSADLLEANVIKNVSLKENLPTLKELLAYTNSLYDSGEWRKYLVNYLILTFNVRNMDLNLQIVRSNKAVNNKDNWIVLHAKDADYLRYVYKTADTFDCKANTITSKNALEAIKNLLGDAESVYLLATADGKRSSDSSLNKVVSRMTMKTDTYKDGLGQANMLKVILGKKSDMKTFEKVSINRGTSISLLNSHYNTNFQNEPKKMENTRRLKNCMAKIPKGELGAEKRALKQKLKAEELAIELE